MKLRIHLSTAVALILLTAILLRANIYRIKETTPLPSLPVQSQVSPAEYARVQLARNRHSDERLKYGWPVTAAEELPVVHPRPNDPEGIVDIVDELAWHPSGIAINAAFALAILACAAFFLERRERHRS